jgi:DNA helicase II / ATP-dependent DNA helicase PcrA
MSVRDLPTPGPTPTPDDARFEAIFDDLNAEQSLAVSTTRGPVVILAGAGSGKTTTITRRIANQIATGEFEPQSILAVTFTTKAAGELADRLGGLGARGVSVRTFHAAALKQLTILGGVSTEVLESKTKPLFQIRSRLPNAFREQHLGELATEIERAKSRRVAPERYLDSLNGHVPPIPAELMAGVYTDYERWKRSARKVDFEDILELTVQMYENDPRAVARLQARYMAITVDEYQDVNLLQQSLLDCWLGERDDVCVVGDDYQAIFGFTGASPQYLIAMRDRFRDGTVVKLEQNYRSTPEILAWANRLAPRLGGISKRLVATTTSGPEPRVTKYANSEDEVEGVVARIRDLLRDGTRPRDIAILYRINARSSAFELALHREQIPFQVAAGGFLERHAWRGVRPRLKAAEQSTNVIDVVAEALDQAGYVPEIKEKHVSPQEYTRQLDLALVESLACVFGPDDTVGDFVIKVEREFASYKDGDTKEAVRLSTYHLAKGLEWEAVFLPLLHDGELPYWRAKEDDEIAEERRLFYVGVTRAKRVLEISTNGVKFPSRFFEEIAPPQTPVRPQNTGGRKGLPDGYQPARPKLSPKSWKPW